MSPSFSGRSVTQPLLTEQNIPCFQAEWFLISQVFLIFNLIIFSITRFFLRVNLNAPSSEVYLSNLFLSHNLLPVEFGNESHVRDHKEHLGGWQTPLGKAHKGAPLLGQLLLKCPAAMLTLCPRCCS